MDLSNDPPPVRVESRPRPRLFGDKGVSAQRKKHLRIIKQETKMEHYSYYTPPALIFNGSGEMSRWADCLGVARVERRAARIVGVACAGTKTKFLFQK